MENENKILGMTLSILIVLSLIIIATIGFNDNFLDSIDKNGEFIKGVCLLLAMVWGLFFGISEINHQIKGK